jgi:hypothetical protein
MTNFKTALLEELQARRTREPIHTRTPLGWKTRAGILGVGAALAGTAIAMTATLSPATAAYVVQKNNDDTVTVTINSLTDTDGLQRDLRNAGVPTVAVFLPAGKTCRPPWFTPVISDLNGLPQVRQTGAGWTFVVDKKKLRPTETLIITPSEWTPIGSTPRKPGHVALELALANGPVNACHLTDLPPYTSPTTVVPAVPQPTTVRPDSHPSN